MIFGYIFQSSAIHENAAQRDRKSEIVSEQRRGAITISNNGLMTLKL